MTIFLANTTPELRGEADKLSKLIELNQINLKTTMMHGDLWIGNLLRAGDKEEKSFVVIDWAGSMLDGIPIYDALRLGISMNVKRPIVTNFIKKHCAALDCSFDEHRVYLLAALGYVGSRNDSFPRRNFHALVRQLDEYSKSLMQFR